MFQTELIIFLQSFASDFLTFFFSFITEIGRITYALPLLLVVMFGISFRAGFILIHVVSWNGLLTVVLKDFFSLPRPVNVDGNVRLLAENLPNPTPFKSMGASSFFSRLPGEVIEAFRGNPFDSWGFPSGHASQAVSLWGSLSLYSRKVWISLVAVLMIVSISLSRMYLGRHFLADILGGLLLGLICTLFFYYKVYRNEKLSSVLSERLGGFRLTLKSGLVLFYFVLIPFLVLFVPNVLKRPTAYLLGLNIGFLLIWFRGIPKDTGRVQQRAARVLVAGIYFLVFYVLLEKGADLFLNNESETTASIRHTLSMVLFLWGATETCVKLKLYQRQNFQNRQSE